MQPKENTTNVRRLQGLALIVSAVCLLLGLYVSQAATFLLVISTILFILGIPAIHSSQPTGSLGLAGKLIVEERDDRWIGRQWDGNAPSNSPSVDILKAES